MTSLIAAEILALVFFGAVVALTYHVFSLGRSLRGAAAKSDTAAQEAEARLTAVEREREMLSTEYDTLMLQSGIGVLVLDAQGIIERANVTAAQFFGSRPATLVGKSLLEATLSHELHKLFIQARSGHTLKREVHVSGHLAEFDLAITIAGIAGTGMPSGRYLFIAQNITDLRRLETVRRDFVANVSHELRTPLTSIRAVAETLQGGALKDPSVAERFLSMIITESERLSRIADDLLILSAAESKVPDKEPVPLTALLENVIHRLEEQADRQEISLSARISAGMCIQANADQMEQVFLNLVDNAIKYTPRGGRVSVVAEQCGEELKVMVSDTGIGIPQQDLPRIFERFYRVDRARSRQTGGTGLGLSIVKHIVESHGGHVTVDSELNSGSTFTVRLPAIVRQTAALVV
jgi:two-component system phosphate regulon sensor histidine kinase PhoR